MGKKINPIIFRMNTTVTPASRWYARKDDFPKLLEQDTKIRKLLKVKLKEASVSRIEIKRSAGRIDIIIHTSKPGIIIGRGGAGIDEMKKELKKKFFGSEKIKININIQEIPKPDLDAAVVMNNMIAQLEKRIPFRRVMKRAIEQVRRAGGKGVKVMIAGRLNGVEIARTETLVEGSVPTQTLRADIDYCRSVANTIYGTLGVKVWIYKGIVFDKDKDKKEPGKKIVKKMKVAPKKPAPKKAETGKTTVTKGKTNK
ncbi:30S ribosomal protein S3 [Patescibacteria group bacterium]|nr:30S ribosomal protein S3 [Patescibacteria group bacterium]MBU1673650.1 30S ribosomal protein S3 [Patescibacteria group bacterium]MBU1963862.1 30S ribosomal protein S3 [Patescibacteria group bacterium]